MSPAFPDKNVWYVIKQISTGNTLFANETAAAFQGPDLQDPGQLWNIFPAGTGTYVLRTYRSSHIYLDVDTASTPVVPYMTDFSRATNGTFWVITSWGNGGYYLTNQAIGVGWNMMLNDLTHLSFGKSDTVPKEAQNFGFEGYPLAINNVAYSSIDLTPVASSSTAVILQSISTINPSSSKQESSRTAMVIDTTNRVQPESTVTPQATLAIGTTNRIPLESSVNTSQSKTTSSSDIQITSSSAVVNVTTSGIQPTFVNFQPTSISTPSHTTTPSVQVKHGISSGVTMGISVSIMALCIFLGWLFFWRRRNPRRLVQELEAKTDLAETRHVTRVAHELEVPTAELQNERDNRWELPDGRIGYNS